MTTYLLVPGMWIGAWAWHDVTGALRDAGHDVYPLTLTGVQVTVAARHRAVGVGSRLVRRIREDPVAAANRLRLRRSAPANLHHAQVGRQRRKRIIGNFGLGSG